MKTESIPILIQLDSWIREGRAVHVREQLKAIVISDISRNELVQYADLARRVQMPELIIRWLRPLIRSEKPVYPAPSTQEIAIYALALSRIGIFKEASSMLKPLRLTKEPQVFNYLGLIDIEQWDYPSALASFKVYVKSKKITDYQRTVGLLNLAACYVGVKKFQNANQILKQLLELTKGAELKLIRANTLELLAQAAIFSENYSQALEFLNSARELIGKENYQYEFFIRKWQAIVELKSNKNFEPIQKIRMEAMTGNFFETVRECDFFIAEGTKNDNLFMNIYFGSHFKSYRKRILQIYGWDKPIPIKNMRVLIPTNLKGLTSTFNLEASKLSLDGLVHDLFHLLLSDSYRSFPLTELFGKIYSKEYFNPTSSISKIDQLINRLRIEFKKNNIPLSVDVKKGRASLKADAPIEIQIRRKKENLKPKLKEFVGLLQSKFPNRAFTTLDISCALEISERTARRFVSQAIKSKQIRKNGLKYICKAAA